MGAREASKKVQSAEKRIPPNAGKGRPKGSLNKTTSTIKQALEEAFHGVGGAEYLMRQAAENPTAFMTLIGKLIPAQVQAELSNPDKSLQPTIDVSKLSTAALNELISAAKSEQR